MFVEFARNAATYVWGSGRNHAGSRPRGRRLRLESLENRELLAADLAITELSTDGQDFVLKYAVNNGDDVMLGRSGNDDLFGEDGHDEIGGGYGNDSIYGDDGVDMLHGDGGEDLIYGGDDSDVIYGGDAADDIFAGNGDDHVYATTADSVSLGAGNATQYEDEDGNNGYGSAYGSRPEVDSLSVLLLGGMWTIVGSVSDADEDLSGLTVTIGGLVDETITVGFDETFGIAVDVPEEEVGWIYATITDSDGNVSDEHWYRVL